LKSALRLHIKEIKRFAGYLRLDTSWNANILLHVKFYYYVFNYSFYYIVLLHYYCI